MSYSSSVMIWATVTWLAMAQLCTARLISIKWPPMVFGLPKNTLTQQWKGTIPAGQVCHELATTLDILPTLAQLVGSALPQNHIIDGFDISPLLTNPQAVSPYVAFYYYQKEQIQAVRTGKWKLHLPLDSTYQNIHWAGFKDGREAQLYNLEQDMSESKNLVEQYPGVVRQLMRLAEVARQDMGDLNRRGQHVRPAALVENPTVRLLPEAGRSGH